MSGILCYVNAEKRISVFYLKPGVLKYEIEKKGFS